MTPRASSPQEGGTPLPLRLRRVRSDGAGVRFGWSQTRWARPVRGVALGARLPSVVRLTQRLQVGVTVVVRITNVVDLVGGLAADAADGHAPLADVAVPAEDARADAGVPAGG